MIRSMEARKKTQCRPTVGEVLGLSLGPHRGILQTLKIYLLLICQTREINSKSRGNTLAHKQGQLITMHSWDFQTKVLQSELPRSHSSQKRSSQNSEKLTYTCIILYIFHSIQYRSKVLLLRTRFSFLL